MSSPEEKTDYDDEIFSMFLSEEHANNQRIAIRYVRTDIRAAIIFTSFLIFTKRRPVKLLDIGCKGVAIESKKKLPLKKKVMLKLLFPDKKLFTIPATIVRQSDNKQHYGLKFDKYNNELGDYLLFTQKDLIFK